MANHVSSLKRARQTIGKTAVNRSNKSKLRGTLRTLREAIAKGDNGELMKVYSSTASLLDKSVLRTSAFIRDDLALRASAGVSVFWTSPLGPIRIDLAEPFIKESYDRSQVFRFSTATQFQ